MASARSRPECGPAASRREFRCEWRAQPSLATRASCASATLTVLWPTDRLIAIPFPLSAAFQARLREMVLTQGRKEEVYDRVSFRRRRLSKTPPALVRTAPSVPFVGRNSIVSVSEFEIAPAAALDPQR